MIMGLCVVTRLMLAIVGFLATVSGLFEARGAWRRMRIKSVIRELRASGEWAQVEEERRRAMSEPERDA
jgi:hypothetical protein